MIKRIIAVALAICMLFCIEVSAEPKITLEPYGNFYIYGEDNDEIAKLLELTDEGVSDYLKKNNIEFLCINSDKSKQIIITATENEFSSNVVNISFLSDEKIRELTPSIIGMENVRGEIVKKNAQKFIKTELKSSDSGGEYLLTQYITVADGELLTLSFFTDINSDIEYIEESFETYKSSMFLSEKGEENNSKRYIIIAALAVFAIATVVIAITVVRDIKKDNSEGIDGEEEKEETVEN